MNKVKMQDLLVGVTLEATATGTQAAASRVVMEAYDSDKLNFTVSYTTGAAETSNTCNVVVEGYNGTDWIQLGEHSITTGTATYVPTIFAVAGAAAATTYTAHFLLDDIVFQKLRVGAYEAGVVTNKGAVSVTGMIS